MRFLAILVLVLGLAGCAPFWISPCGECQSEECQMALRGWDSYEEIPPNAAELRAACASACRDCENARSRRVRIPPEAAMMMWQSYEQQRQAQEMQRALRDMSDNYQRMHNYRVPPLYP